MACHPANIHSGINLSNKQKAVKNAFYGPTPFGKLSYSFLSTVRKKFWDKPIGNHLLKLYGPIGNLDYWQKKMQREHLDSVEEAKTQLCGNCAAYNISSHQKKCGGTKGKKIAVLCWATQKPLITNWTGYCDIWNFSCAALRTCDSWLPGGPKRR